MQALVALHHRAPAARPPEPPLTPAGDAAGRGGSTRYAVPWVMQVRLLTWRLLLNSYRSGWSLAGGAIQAAAISAVTAGIFWQLSDDSVDDIEARSGLLYLVGAMEYYIWMIILIERYCAELTVFDREHEDRWYSPVAYFFAHFISSLPVMLIQPIIFAIPIYFCTGLRSGSQHVLVFILVNVLICQCVNGLAWLSVSCQRDFAVASLIGNMQYTFITLTSGFLVNLNEMPRYVRWVKNISYLSYTYRILMSNEFHDRTFPGCPVDDDAACSPYDGNSILDSQDIGTHDYRNVGTWCVVISIAFIYYAIAVMNLCHLSFPVSGSAGGDGGSEDDPPAPLLESLSDAENPMGGELPPTADTATARALSGDRRLSKEDVDREIFSPRVTVQVSIETLCVRTDASIASVRDDNSRASSKLILQGVYATIHPSRLTALMGSSGCG